ncbi:hypothetical protein KEM52_001241, partial [Ascosphaera acerosa]
PPAPSPPPGGAGASDGADTTPSQPRPQYQAYAPSALPTPTGITNGHEYNHDHGRDYSTSTAGSDSTDSIIGAYHNLRGSVGGAGDEEGGERRGSADAGAAGAVGAWSRASDRYSSYTARSSLGRPGSTLITSLTPEDDEAVVAMEEPAHGDRGVGASGSGGDGGSGMPVLIPPISVTDFADAAPAPARVDVEVEEPPESPGRSQDHDGDDVSVASTIRRQHDEGYIDDAEDTVADADADADAQTDVGEHSRTLRDQRHLSFIPTSDESITVITPPRDSPPHAPSSPGTPQYLAPGLTGRSPPSQPLIVATSPPSPSPAAAAVAAMSAGLPTSPGSPFNLVAQELRNIAAVRRMSLDVDGIDPDLHAFTSFESIPTLAPTKSRRGRKHKHRRARRAGDPADSDGDDGADRGTRDSSDRDRDRDRDGAADDESDSDDETGDAARLYWVPAAVHPELAPNAFRKFLNGRVEAMKRRRAEQEALARSNSAASISSLASTRSTASGTGDSLSPSVGGAVGLQRRKSLLSRQVEPDAVPTPGAGAGASAGARSMGALAEDGGDSSPSSQNTSPVEDGPQDLSHRIKNPNVAAANAAAALMGLDDDRPILPPQPPTATSSLRRSTRTNYRKGSVSGASRGHSIRARGGRQRGLTTAGRRTAGDEPGVSRPALESTGQRSASADQMQQYRGPRDGDHPPEGLPPLQRSHTEDTPAAMTAAVTAEAQARDAAPASSQRHLQQHQHPPSGPWHASTGPAKAHQESQVDSLNMAIASQSSRDFHAQHHQPHPGLGQGLPQSQPQAPSQAQNQPPPAPSLPRSVTSPAPQKQLAGTRTSPHHEQTGFAARQDGHHGPTASVGGRPSHYQQSAASPHSVPSTSPTLTAPETSARERPPLVRSRDDPRSVSLNADLSQGQASGRGQAPGQAARKGSGQSPPPSAVLETVDSGVAAPPKKPEKKEGTWKSRGPLCPTGPASLQVCPSALLHVRGEKSRRTRLRPRGAP